MEVPSSRDNAWRALAGELARRGWFDGSYSQVIGSHGELGFGWGSATGGNAPLLLIQTTWNGFEVLRLKSFLRRVTISAVEAVDALEDFARDCGFVFNGTPHVEDRLPATRLAWTEPET